MQEDDRTTRLKPKRQGDLQRRLLSVSLGNSDSSHPTRIYSIIRRPEELRAFEVTPQSVAEILIPVYGAKRLSAAAISIHDGLIYIGNWVVMDSKGIVNVYRSDDFAERFQLLDDK